MSRNMIYAEKKRVVYLKNKKKIVLKKNNNNKRGKDISVKSYQTVPAGLLESLFHPVAGLRDEELVLGQRRLRVQQLLQLREHAAQQRRVRGRRRRAADPMRDYKVLRHSWHAYNTIHTHRERRRYRSNTDKHNTGSTAGASTHTDTHSHSHRQRRVHATSTVKQRDKSIPRDAARDDGISSWPGGPTCPYQSIQAIR